MKLQSFVGIFLVAIFVVSSVVVSKSDLSLIRTAIAGYGGGIDVTNATNAVVKAEDTEKQSDLNSAQVLVSALSDPADDAVKTSLQNRINTLQKKIDNDRADRNREKKNHNKKSNKKSSQVTVQKKVAEFAIHNNAKDIASYRKVSAIKKANPAQFRNLQSVFNKYNKVGGKLKVQPSAQTVSAINMFRGYNGYSAYLNYVGKLKK